MLLYLDASAIVKMVVEEPESAALSAMLRSWPERASSSLALAEVPRALSRMGARAAALARAERVLERITLIRLDVDILKAAGRLPSPTLRTLDALHLASALFLGTELHGLVTYDLRLAEAATNSGLEVLAPA